MADRNCIDCAHFGFSLSDDFDIEPNFTCARKHHAYGKRELQEMVGVTMCPTDLAGLRRMLRAANECDQYRPTAETDGEGGRDG